VPLVFTAVLAIVAVSARGFLRASAPSEHEPAMGDSVGPQKRAPAPEPSSAAPDVTPAVAKPEASSETIVPPPSQESASRPKAVRRPLPGKVSETPPRPAPAPPSPSKQKRTDLLGY
jgi:hypothetical protein